MRIKALSTIIQWDKTRMVILNPGEEGEISDDLGQEQIDAGHAKLAGGKPAANPAPSQPAEPAEPKLFTAEHVGGGWYTISGPGAPEGKIKKADVDAKLAELEAAYAAANSAPEEAAETDQTGEGNGEDEDDQDDAPTE